MGKSNQRKTIKIINLRHGIDDSVDLRELVAREIGLTVDAILHLKILRKSTDARQTRLDYVYTIVATIEAQNAVITKIITKKNIEEYHEEGQRVFPKLNLKHQPVIIGCGPAGIFAALTLLERGIAPLIIERGQRIGEREQSVEAFWKNGKLNPESNVLFGEGGAGTFSDGKLTTRTKSPLKKKVFEKLVACGAPPEIMHLHKPHIGTDRLKALIPALVTELERRGGHCMFNTRLTDITIDRGRVCGIVAGETLKTDHLFLATGHSARDLYNLLHKKGIALKGKDFSVGVRIEHPQELIDRLMWGARDGHKDLGPADYFITFQDRQTGRGVYSFCMCPGGYVIGCASQHDGLCTNGMSAYRRNSPWANAAIVVGVRSDDCGSKDPLAGIIFQEALEQHAFKAGGGGFHAPAQCAADFVSEKIPPQNANSTFCSYKPGVRPYDLKTLLPGFICRPLQRGLKAFNKKYPGFIEKGMLIGVETRTSSPVRILRDERNLHAIGVSGLIPIGEGSGYAGGIMSSAVDGIRAAQAFDL